MKIKYQAPKGYRIKKQFLSLGLDADTEDWISWWYYPESKEWRNDLKYRDNETYAVSSCNCNSLKSAIRKIKQWKFPKGTKFRLCSMWVGHDVYITV